MTERGGAVDEAVYAWVDEVECYGVTVVEGMTGDEAVRALTDGSVVPLERWRDAGEDAPTVGVLDVRGTVLLWENYPWIGLDPRVPRRLSARGRCVSVAYGMTQSMLTVAEGGTTLRAFDPLLRAPSDPEDSWYDEEFDPEFDRLGDPLPAEADVDWAGHGVADLRFVQLLTGVVVPEGLWDDVRLRWFTYDPLPPEPPAHIVLPPLLAALHEASPQERHARLRAGLVAAAEILGLQEHPPFLRALADGDALLAVADPSARWREDPRREAELHVAFTRHQEWEFRLGQRVEPLLYPTPGEPWPPPRAGRYRATPEEKAELRLAMACSDYLEQAGIGHDDFGSAGIAQLQQAVGDRFPEVEAAMLMEPPGI